MYIYLIKYFNEIIAAADGDIKADEVIQQYMRNNKDMKIDNFKKEAIRFFKEETRSTEDVLNEISNDWNKLSIAEKDEILKFITGDFTLQNKNCVRLTEHDYDRCEDCYNYEFCKEESDEV